MITPERDRELMQKAVDLSRQSRPEDDGRIHPFVGAVIAHPNGEIISSGYRGQHTAGNHAEQEALVGIREDLVAGAVVYSTLEPCTVRGKQMPCCWRLIEREVAEVVIGILDPNRDIRGRGWWRFEEQRIRVRNFGPDFVKEIREMNKEFIDYQLGPGMMITAIQPEGSAEIPVDEEHRAGRKELAVRRGRVLITGTYRVRPSDGDKPSLLARFGSTYYPQAPVELRFDRENSVWRSSAYLGWPAMQESHEYEIIVARLSDDLKVASRHYNKVHDFMKERYQKDNVWVGFDMEPEPPGFERLASLTLMVEPQSGGR
jgi:pyrimidine deaminase RibD-like protein